MLTKEVFVRGRSVYANGDVTLIRTSIGVYDMHVLFDAAEWLDFPVKVVFGYGSEQVTQTLALTALTADEWAAEASVEIPWEVMAELGTVRVTFQGSDSTGGSEKHIITAMSGGLWSVAEEGDVTDGTVPTPAPTEDEWNQAFEAAMIAANDASSAAVAANSAAVSANTQAVRAEAAAEAAEGIVAGDIATTEKAGIVKPDGTTITVEEDGTISAVSSLATPDWEQTDETAGDYIKNRPFGPFLAELEIFSGDGLSSVTTQYLEVGTAKWYRMSPYASPTAIVSGKAYTVTIDGTSYEVTATNGYSDMVDDSQPRGETTYIPGPSLAGTGFKIHRYYAFIAGGGEHSLTIETTGETDVQIAPKWIPAATASSIGGVTVDDSTIEATDGELSVKAVPSAKLTGTISADNLPSYVDDVEEYASVSNFPATGETGKIYVALDSNASYRWGGSAYVRVASGENATTTADGLMSHADKAKLDGIEAGANNYSLPTMSPAIRGGAKLGDGLSLSSDVLSLGPLTKSGSGASVETDGCALFAVTGEGWAEQQVTTGKNLLPNTVASQTLNGVTLTKHDDGSVTINGTASENTLFVIGTLPVGTLANVEHFLSGCPTGGSSTTYRLLLQRTDTWEALQDIGSGLSVPSSMSAYPLRVGVNILASATVNNLTFYPQLEAGSQATEYEPYTGGKPAPSPDYPQEIRVCRGRNLFDKNDVTEYSYIDENGDAVTTTSHTFVASGWIPVKGGETYTLSRCGAAGTAPRHAFYDADKTFIEAISSGPFTATAPANAAWMRISPKFAALDATQLNTGSTPMPYVPYGHVGIEVQREDVSRVVFDGSDDEVWALTSTANLFSVRVYGAYAASAAADNYVWSDVYVTSQTTSNANQPDMSTKISAGGTYIYIKDTRYATVEAFKAALAVNPLTFYYLNNKHTGSVPAFPTVTTPVPLPSKGWTGAAGDYADALSIDSAGRWEWVNEVIETVIDGVNVRAVEALSSGDGRRWRINATTSLAASNDEVRCMASNLIGVSFGDTWNPAADCIAAGATTGDGLYMWVGSLKASSQSDVNTWLALNNVTVLHPLAAPTTESGYITLPDLPSGAVVSCPELQECGVSWFVAGASELVEHAKNWGRRAEYENEEIENAVADLAARVALLEV